MNVIVFGDGSVLGPILLCLAILVPLVGAQRGIRWLRWIAVPILVFFSILCALAALENDGYMLFLASAGFLYMAYGLLPLFRNRSAYEKAESNSHLKPSGRMASISGIRCY